MTDSGTALVGGDMRILTFRMMAAIITAVMMVAITTDAEAGRRTLRVDDGAWQIVGDCSGTGVSSNGLLLSWDNKVFSGYNDPDLAFDASCEISELDDIPFAFDQDPGLSELVEGATDGSISAVRYSYIEPKLIEFQWVFVFFPDDIVIVGLNGLIDGFGDPIALSNISYIRDTTTYEYYWRGGVDGFDGEYFCFVAGEFVGTWGGAPVGNDPLDACLPGRPIFSDRFEVLVQ